MKKVRIESCDSDSEEDIPDYEKCIICKRSSPDFSKKPFIIIVNWAGANVKNVMDGFSCHFVKS